jgi:uncharacterized protein YkwD
MKMKYLAIASIAILTGCGSNHTSQDGDTVTEFASPDRQITVGAKTTLEESSNKKNRALSYTQQSQIREDGLSYLNQLRQNAGMITYIQNDNLNTSAYNHANYIKLNNITGHGESVQNSGFTGASSANRAVAAGYGHRHVGENLSTGQVNVSSSIDDLFSAIYHRFNFLDFSFDEIGIGSESLTTNGDIFNYNLGLSQLTDICSGSPFDGYGRYYYQVCADSSFKVEESEYKNALSQNQNDNPSYVLWPHKDQNDTKTVFFEEYPDPLPDCSVSGYPISIQFNPAKNGEIDIIDFKLYSNNQEITNTRILDDINDPNGKFTSNQAALFPQERLTWNTNYKAVVQYKEDGRLKDIAWNFKTRSLPYPHYTINRTNTTLNIKNGQTFLLYIAPQDCNDSSAGYSMSYSSNLSINSSFYDQNMIQLTITGGSGTINLHTNNGRDIKLNISN